LASIQDSNFIEEFFRIQQQFVIIIVHDVCRKGGLFYGGNVPPNSDIETHLQMQRDDRLFMTKEGILPFPEPSQKS
jgi:hypothetical protein